MSLRIDGRVRVRLGPAPTSQRLPTPTPLTGPGQVSGPARRYGRAHDVDPSHSYSMSTESEAVWDRFDALASTPGPNPWAGKASKRVLNPDLESLRRLIAVPIEVGATVRSGLHAKAVDVWLARELRRAGFGPDEVWPRATRPRVLPREVALLLQSLPTALRDDLVTRLETKPSGAASADASVLGKAYNKQVDVVISQWARVEAALARVVEQPRSGLQQQPQLDLGVRRPHMGHDPPLPGHGLRDLHRGRARGRTHPPDPRHPRSLRAPISASKPAAMAPFPQVTEPSPRRSDRGDRSQVRGCTHLLKRSPAPAPTVCHRGLATW